MTDDTRLRRDIRRLGDLLGETLARQESPELVDEIDTWEGYDTHDIGHAFLAETVYDLRDEIRAALDGKP